MIVMWKALVNFMHELFPGEQLEVLLEMAGLFIVMIALIRLRAEIWDRAGLSIVFLTEQKFQTLFGEERVEKKEAREDGQEGRRKMNPDSA